MNLQELLTRVGLAFGIGLLIGLERGWHSRTVREGGRTAGVRTFAITGLLGGIVAALAAGAGMPLSIAGAILLGTSFIAFAFVIMTFEREENRAADSFSATTTIAALLTFMLGAYALLGDMRVAAAAAVTTAGILIVRESLHAWVAKITVAEFQSALVLLAMSCIALPIMPDRPIAWLGQVNPREVWLIAIILAAISFAGYIAVKLLGERRGVLVAAAVGGLVSSTAVTLANARRAKAGEGSPQLLATGAALATAVSFVRVAVLVVVLKPTLAPLTVPPLLAGAVVVVIVSLASLRGFKSSDDPQRTVELRNPFGFWAVTALALMMGVLIIAGRLIHEYFGALGTVAGAAAMGLLDVDAMTVSVTRLVPDAVELQTATYAILAGVAANTLTKVLIGTIIGRTKFALVIVMISAASAIAAGMALLAAMKVIGSS